MTIETAKPANLPKRARVRDWRAFLKPHELPEIVKIENEVVSLDMRRRELTNALRAWRARCTSRARHAASRSWEAAKGGSA